MTEVPADLAATVTEIQRVLALIGAGGRPVPTDARVVRALERRGAIRRNHAAKKFELTALGRQLADHVQ